MIRHVCKECKGFLDYTAELEKDGWDGPFYLICPECGARNQYRGRHIMDLRLALDEGEKLMWKFKEDIKNDDKPVLKVSKEHIKILRDAGYEVIDYG